MSSCLFCKIIHKEIPAQIVYDDASAVGILDIHPVSPGHTIIIPRVHAENILALPEEATKDVFSAVKAMTGRLNEKLGPDGFTIGINHGKVSGQTIDHLHIHIIPRWEGDGGGSIHSIVNNKPTESVEEIAEKIKKVISD